MNRKLAIVFVVLCLGNIYGLAQIAEKKSVPNELALKIISFKGNPASYHPIPDEADRPEGSWTPRFQKIPNWRLPAGELPIKTVNFVLRRQGEAVKVTVSLYRGQKFHEKEEFVAVYLIRENETVMTKELTKFGIEPFELSVVKVTPSVSVLPTVVNETDSLEVSVEPNYSTLPSYKIRVMNNSGKAVSAFALSVTLNGAFQLSGMPQGFQGEPLIKPGATYVDIIPNTFRPEKNSNEQISAVVPNQIIIIGTVIFADGTYEGGRQSAADFLAFTLGRKSQLKQIISLLQAAAENDFEFDKLNQQLSSLSIEVDETEFNEFVKQFPSITEREKSRLRDSVRIASNLIKRTVLTELKVFEANQKPEANTTQDWLKATRGKYQNWLARLSAARQ